jgi:hypothetical protein
MIESKLDRLSISTRRISFDFLPGGDWGERRLKAFVSPGIFFGKNLYFSLNVFLR